MTRAKDISKVVSDANFGGTLDVTGDVDIDGTTNLDAVDIDGTVTQGSNTSDLRFNINSSNQYGLKFFNAGNSSGTLGGRGADIMTFSDASGATIMEMNAGQITMPLQPAFLAHPSTTITNISVGAHALIFNTERFDQNADYDTSNGTFTAPVTGKYQLNVHFYMLAIDTAAAYYEGLLITSNKTYGVIIDPNFSSDLSYYHMELVVLADMDAADTATIRMDQSGGSAQTDMSANCTFSGYLVA